MTKVWVRSHWKTTTGSSTRPLLAQTQAMPLEWHSLTECTMSAEEVWTVFTPLFSFTFITDQTTLWDRNTLWTENIMPLRWVNEWMTRWMDEWMSEWWVGGWVVCEWVSGWVGSEWVTEWVGVFVCGWAPEWVSEWANWNWMLQRQFLHQRTTRCFFKYIREIHWSF